MNTTSSTAPNATGIHSQAGQPSDWPSTSGTMNASTMALSSTTPTRSSRIGRSDRVSGTNRAARTKIAMPTGMLMRNTVRQPRPQRSASMSQPPSTGPSTAARPLTPPMSPYIGARSRGLNSACTDARSCGTMRAAKRPCAMRVTTSASPDQAAAATAEASGEPGDADEEDPSAPEQVAQTPAGDQRDREGEHVPAHDPFELRLGCPEVGADRRQGDLHDGDVEQVHERGEQEDADGEPSACGGGHGSSSLRMLRLLPMRDCPDMG